MQKLLIITTIALSLSCSTEFDKVMKNGKKEVRYKLGVEYYNKGKYNKALKLFNSIFSVYQGKPQGERIQYFIADSYYNEKMYDLAAFNFDRMVNSYPKSSKAETAAYLSAFSYYLLSPTYSNDQSYSYKAITSFQKFINGFPNSEKVVEADSLIRVLRKKLEKKHLEIGKGYHKTTNYRAAKYSLRSFMDEFPDTDYTEEALYYLTDASYRLAINSIESLKKQRLLETKTTYLLLLKENPNTKHLKQINKIKERVMQELKKYEESKGI